ncbi:MAG: autotransporter-associated beta strand repeat-containing protein, partial [Candidatus Accumulibacter sp.]|nr:autotransporter-associated beta strand repeat-containing protein [Accumulibacter sp.]
GTLSIGSDTNIGSGTNTLDGGALELTGTSYTKAWTVTTDSVITNGAAVTFGGDLSGAGGITKTGSGTLTLTGNNAAAHTGGMTVTGGTLSIGSDTNIGSGTNTLNGGTLDLNSSAGTYAKAWTVDADSAINAGTGVAATLSGALSGAGGITKTGSGSLTLTGNNTAYTGDTTVTAGTIKGNIAVNTHLTVQSGATYDGSDAIRTIKALNGTGNVKSNDTLTVQSGVFGGVISDSNSAASLEKTGAGTLTLSGTNTYTGGTTITDGLIEFSSAADNFGTGKITLDGGGLKWNSNTEDISGKLNALEAGGGAFDTNGNDVTLATTITGTGGITKQGVGMLTLSGTNTYTGDTTVSDGTLQIGAGGNTGSVTGNITNNAKVAFNRSNDMSYDGILSGGGSLEKTGAGTLTLSGTNTYTGDTTVSDGTLQIGAGSTSGSVAGNIVNNAQVSFNRSDDMSYDGILSGNGSLEKTGTGTLTLTGNNSYTGDTTVTAGTLAGNIAANTHLTVQSGATYDGSGAIRTINALNGTGNVTSNDTLTVQSGVFGGVISDSNSAASLTKDGAGTLTLSGTNTYTGMTTVEAGTLDLTGSGVISDQLTLHSGANFDTGGVPDPFWNGSASQANLTRLDVQGGATPATYTGTLNVTSGEMNFYVPSTMSSGTLLTVTGNANVAGATVRVGIAGSSSPLAAGNQITLLNTTGTLNASGINTTANGSGMQGVTLNYNFDLTQTTNQLLATVTSAPTVTEQSKSLPEGHLSGTSFLSQGSDFLMGKGLAAARSAVAEGSQNSPEVFAALGYGKVHNQTGSSVAVKGYNLVTGLAFGRRLENTNLTGAFFFEYGNGDYNSYNSFSTGKVQGRGDTGYKGIGVLARSDFASGYHIEGSLRGGKIDSDYRSNELVDNQGNRARYDTKTGYLGAHIGAGKRWELNTQDSIEITTQGIWTRQSGESARLSTGERLKFQEIDSKRIRIGTRYTHAMSGTLKAYAGIAVEREFGGEAKATTNGYKIDAPTLKGNTGIGEIGITSTPTAGKPLFLDFGIQGYAGKREGVTGSLRVNYFF